VIEALLASGNPGKLAELREVLSDWDVEALAGEGPEETGTSYLENARIKARFGRALAPAEAYVLGEDSGIECAALGGAPGLHSARWAPGDQADALLARLEGETDRRARMVSELVCLTPEGTAEKFIWDGDNTYGGRYVTNPSGGLLSKGHPLGATGLAQCAELVWQLRGQADKRQVEGATHALQHNLGLGGACVVTLYGKA